jgi:pilus assembly protein CpaE
MRELWKRLGVREDEDVRIVLNRTSRRREIQPDLARKVVGETMASTTIPADFNAFEAAVNTGSPSRMEDNKIRGAFESLATELAIVPQPDEALGREHEPRSLLARLGGERGQSTAEVMGLFPVLIAVILGLWQIALTGYTYIAAGHAAREGARQLAVLSTSHTSDERWQERRKADDEPAYRRVARQDLPASWRKKADIRLRGDVTVSVRLRVPLIIPGVRTPLTIGSTADTVLEDGDLTDRQETTPHKGDRGEGGNWN